MSFFTQDFLDFFQELQTNNNKEWFDDNRKRYKKSVKEPFANFIQHIIDKVQEDDPQVLIMAKDAIFRINRDIRFAKDKSPYKTHVAAIVSKGGRKDKSLPGMYLHFSHDHLGLGGGVYMCDTKNIKALRSEIIYNLEEFNGIIDDKDFKQKFGELKGEKNKRLPKEMLEFAEKQPLLYNKQYYYFGELPSNTILDPKLDKIVMEHYFTGKPMMNFLGRALEQQV